MYGAILGDIVGSCYEFDRGPWTKDFCFFSNSCAWTDDTVMTVAVSELLKKRYNDAKKANLTYYRDKNGGCRT